jgi:hypothetical protein
LRFVEGSALETALKKVGHNLGRKEDSLQEHEYEEDYHGRHVGTSGGADDGGKRKSHGKKTQCPCRQCQPEPEAVSGNLYPFFVSGK